MKKVLFATTALIATASVAAAEVRISGYGRFGLDWNEANDGTAMGETSITSRLRLQFDMSTETDGGVTFGARFRAQAENRDGAPASGPITVVDTNSDGNFDTINIGGGAVFNGARFFASYGGFTVGVGNIIGAFEGTQGLYLETRTAGVGVDGAGFQSLVANMAGNSFDWDAYSSAGSGVQGLEVIYSGGDWGVHVSYSDSSCTANFCNPALQGETNTAVSGYYNFGDWTVALGYNDESNVGVGQDNDLILFTVQGDLGFGGLRFAYAEMDNTAAVGGDSSKMGLYGIFDIGAASTLVAFVTDEDSPGLMSDGTGYGLHYSYDLGGGVSFETGWISNSMDNDTFQAGVYFSF